MLLHVKIKQQQFVKNQNKLQYSNLREFQYINDITYIFKF